MKTKTCANKTDRKRLDFRPTTAQQRRFYFETWFEPRNVTKAFFKRVCLQELFIIGNHAF